MTSRDLASSVISCIDQAYVTWQKDIHFWTLSPKWQPILIAWEKASLAWTCSTSRSREGLTLLLPPPFHLNVNLKNIPATVSKWTGEVDCISSSFVTFCQKTRQGIVSWYLGTNTQISHARAAFSLVPGRPLGEALTRRFPSGCPPLPGRICLLGPVFGFLTYWQLLLLLLLLSSSFLGVVEVLFASGLRKSYGASAGFHLHAAAGAAPAGPALACSLAEPQ